MDGLNARPTVDVDFMAYRISRDREELLGGFGEILAIPCIEDGVSFDIDSLKAESITVDKKYPGTRFTFTAYLDTIEHKMAIDVGFGDVVTPGPEKIDFPKLLESTPDGSLLAYSMETIIAEKFHTMIDRDEANNRMKDFFDLYQILRSKPINGESLYDAIKATFSNRGLQPKPELHLFTEAFRNDQARLVRWHSFLKKIKWPVNIPFTDVMEMVETRLRPYYETYIRETNP